MRKVERGFTLVELMIVITIIGTLAALAIPAYQDFTIRGQVSEGLTLAAGAQAAIEDYYLNHGDWPADNADAGIAAMGEIFGKYAAHVSIVGNAIEVRFEGDSHQALHGRTIDLVAIDNEGSLTWICAGVGIDKNRLPSMCRIASVDDQKKKKSKL